jgi:hypothetical protein
MEPFAAGQVWTYKTRSGEDASRVVVCRVETDPKLGEVVHIQVNGLKLQNKHAPEGFSGVIGHLPYSADALRKSVTKLEATGTKPPEFEEGYKTWRAAFEQHKAGVWTVGVAEAVATMERAMSQ